MQKDKKIIKDFFNSHAKRFGDHVHALGWESDHTQKMRFWVLSEIEDLNGASILDVGCGKGDLLAFFSEQDIRVEYYGVDFSKELITMAKQQYPEANFFYRDFLEDSFYPEIDYTISSGIANIRTPKNKEYIQEVISKMVSISKKGAAVNMLSSYSPETGKDPGIYYFSPEEMLKFAKKLSSDIILRHDYLPNDFTLYIYKRKNIIL
ncbi:methyltransferase domain-containing protein [candidate division KSB1 bacterium]